MADSTLPRAEPPVFRPLVPAGLPIHRFDDTAFAGFYAPGYLCVVPLEGARAFEQGIAACADPHGALLDKADGCYGSGLVHQLVFHAQRAVERAAALREEPFRPECLTLYLNNECNLRCSYCYANPTPGPARRLELKAIAAAARLVAGNCREKGRRFYAVFHGGGEPTLNPDLLRRAVERVQAVAGEVGVPTFLYVATNGAMPREQALWLAQHFDLVGLSCDGPVGIHDRQRPRWDGSGSLSGLERTAKVLRQEGCRLHVRTTVTEATVHRQAEIATFICRYLEPEEIHVEPVYGGGRSTGRGPWEAGMAAEYVTYFLEARAVAGSHGVPMLSSGSRPASVHGPYCNVYRQVLNLVPGGVATACFKLCDADQVRMKEALIGRINSETGAFEIESDRVERLRQRLEPAPPACADCFNRYHCALDCPDRCPLDGPAGRIEAQPPGFRCHVQKATTSALLHETAQRLWSEVQAGGRELACGTAVV